MVLFVLDDIDRLDEILDAWETVGVSGVTIVESSGLSRRKIARQVGTTFMAGFNRLVGEGEDGHYTLLVVVPDLEACRVCLAAVETVVGDLDQPETGIFAAWQVDLVKGVPAELHSRGGET